MTTPRLNKIGVVSHYSPQGDWTFMAAFHLAESHGAGLNVFHFLESPYDVPQNQAPARCPRVLREDPELIRAERELRTRYDEWLGDFSNIGFRVCASGRHNQELHRCLKKKDYQLLFIPCPRAGATFGNMPIEEFAFRFTAPVVLVGPENAERRRVNAQAAVLLDSLQISRNGWSEIGSPARLQPLPVF